MARDVSRQINHGSSNISGQTPRPVWSGGKEGDLRLFRRLEQAEPGEIDQKTISHFRPRQTRQHSIAANSEFELCAFHRNGSRHAQDPTLGSRIRRVGDSAGHCESRCQIYDRASTPNRSAWPHGANGMLTTKKGADDVRVQNPAQILERKLANEIHSFDAGIIYKNIESIEVLSRLLDGILPSLITRHVKLEELGPRSGGAEFLCDRLPLSLGKVRHKHGCARGGKCTACFRTDTARRAGHQRDLAVELEERFAAGHHDLQFLKGEILFRPLPDSS